MVNNRKIMILTVIFIVLVIASFIYIQYQTNEHNGITAMEGKIIADSIAGNWSNNASLVYVHPIGIDVGDGYNTEWGYTYWDGTEMQNNALGIKVDINGNVWEEITHHYPHEYPIKNWAIDSNEAYNIALSTTEIKNFMQHNPIIDSFFLATSEENSNDSVWYILWAYDAGIDDPKSADIYIDATTGEVLYVDVDD